MKKYFVDIMFYVPKNNLEERLQASFKEIEHTVISEDQVKTELDLRYAKVLSEYHRNKGKGKAIFDRNVIDSKPCYDIGKSITVNLIPVRREML